MDILVTDMVQLRGKYSQRGEILTSDDLDEAEASRLVLLGRALPLDGLIKYIENRMKVKDRVPLGIGK